MTEQDRIRLQHMLDSARQAVEFAQGKSRKDLDVDSMLVLALMKAIELVGEAANQVSPTAQKTLSSIPWQDIIAMRHRLVHSYFDINLDILWETIQQDLPELIASLEAVSSDFRSKGAT